MCLIMKDLAIIIPAYKGSYLSETLDSISRQTCKDFTLYIGDDNSPDNIEEIVLKYKDCIDIVYNRFEKNLGGIDLARHWNRCVNMNQGEPWLWLFSDDDIMSETCVEDFYNFIGHTPQAKLVHYNIAIVDNDKKVINQTSYPTFLSTQAYIDEKLKGHIVSMVVEFVFHRDVFYQSGGFESFDLAWGSDFVSWIKFSDQSNGIYTCPASFIYWRYSGDNISSDHSDVIIFRKLKSMMRYTEWILRFSISKGYGHPFFYTKFALGETWRHRKHLSMKQFCFLISQYFLMIKGKRGAVLYDFLRICIKNSL